MAWTVYSKPIEVLSATDINNIKENIEIIRGLLIEKGFTVGSTKNLQASENTQFIEMFDILSNIEYNLDIISDNDAKSAYYVEPKIIGNFASNRDDVWRWIQVLNDMYEILNGTKRKWTVLKCKNGYPTIEKQKLVARGDWVE